MKKIVVAFLSVVDAINEWLGRIVAYLLILMMLIVSYEVVMRYVFTAPTIWAMEASCFLLFLITALGGAYTLLRRGHVNVDLLYARFSKRGQAIVDCITFLLFLGFIAVLIWHSWEIAIKAITIKEHSDSGWAPPIYHLKVLLPVGAFLVLLQGSVKFVRDLAIAITGKGIFG